MTSTILYKVANGSIDINLFIKWLSANNKDEYIVEELNYKCSRTDFITYFLNFIHEEILWNSYEHQKFSTVKQLDCEKEEPKVDKKRDNIDRDFLTKSTSFPLDKIKTTSNDSNQENCSLTSPKLTKIQSESLLELTYSSPLSPLFQKNNDFSTPRNKSLNLSQKSVEKVSPLCLSDFIVNTPITKKKSKRGHLFIEPVRRITPTCIKAENGDEFRRTINCFDDFNNAKEVPSPNYNENRHYLVEERRKVLSNINLKEPSMTIFSRKLASLPSAKQEPDAVRSCVTNENALNNISKVYITILNESLVLNITSEIYFLINLLTKKQFHLKEEQQTEELPNGFSFLNSHSRQESNETNKIALCQFFNSIHNIIYFTTICLESQIDVLKNFDKTTLILLSENQRLNSFSKKCSEQLQKISDTICDRLSYLSDNVQHTTVCFNLDTDNRDNFPSDSTFHSFRKQRDLFYEILRIWEISHLQPGWNFSVGLAGKIKSLLTLQSDPTNFLHLCRLFKDQLLSTCGKYHKDEDIVESDFSLLSSLPNVNADKLNRLKNRLVTKKTSNGLNAVPVFMGYEEFYKDFIVVASNYFFNRHLCDALIADIIKINDTKFIKNDYEDSDVDVPTKKTFVTCTKYLKVLAKFLGFVETLPYKSDATNYSENLLQTHISIRQQVLPPLDIKQIIIRSINEHQTILTIPWISDYLAMLDFVTLRLPYYTSVYKLLFMLYKTCNHYMKSGSYNNSLVKFSLGWLFELPNFPDTEFYTNLNEMDIPLEIKNSNDKRLDDLQMVDQHILYTFCPFLEEIKKLLLSDVSSNNTTVKHITPVTTLQSAEQITKKKLEQQLEDAFFNGQPVSVRKTVEFVSERIASSCVKHICYNIVPEFKRIALKDLDNLLKSYRENSDWSNEHLKVKAAQMAQSYLTSLKEQCNKTASDIIKEKIPMTIESLLALDTLIQTKTTCISITVKMCKDRIKQWNDSHLNVSIFMKDFNFEVQKVRKGENKSLKSKAVFALSSVGNSEEHNDNCLSAAHLLELIKCLCVDVLENTLVVTEEVVLDALNKAFITLSERCDVNDSINFYICTLLFDFSLLLVVHRSDLAEKDLILRQFVKVWKEFYGKTDDLFKNLLCPRNITLMAQPCTDQVVWTNMARLVSLLVKTNLLSCDNFEVQCTSFYQKDWDKVTLQNMSTFLNKFIEFYKKDGGNMNKFTYLLQFLSDFCIDL